MNTYYVPSGQIVALPGQVSVTGAGNGTDMATIYDSPGSNALVGQQQHRHADDLAGQPDDQQVRQRDGEKGNGSSDTVHEAAIDFVLTALGWTSD